MMTILSDRHIRDLAIEHGMISPFYNKQSGKGGISYGLSSFGYDARLCPDNLKVFTNIYNGQIDPKDFNPSLAMDVGHYVSDKYDHKFFLLPPHSFSLGRTLEKFKLPRNVLAICMGKSTYARCGIIVNVTPLEPEWEGHVTLELSNTTPNPARVYAGEGICQFIFLQGIDCETSYADRKGKYQNQVEIELPKVLRNK